MKFILAVLLGLVPGIVLAQAQPFAPATPEEEQEIREYLKDSDLRDPFSVQFRNLQVRPLAADGETTGSGRGKIYCGEYNAKNGMGGYVGWDRFLITNGLTEDGGVKISFADRLPGWVNLMCKEAF